MALWRKKDSRSAGVPLVELPVDDPFGELLRDAGVETYPGERIWTALAATDLLRQSRHVDRATLQRDLVPTSRRLLVLDPLGSRINSYPYHGFRFGFEPVPFGGRITIRAGDTLAESLNAAPRAAAEIFVELILRLQAEQHELRAHGAIGELKPSRSPSPSGAGFIVADEYGLVFTVPFGERVAEPWASVESFSWLQDTGTLRLESSSGQWLITLYDANDSDWRPILGRVGVAEQTNNWDGLSDSV